MPFWTNRPAPSRVSRASLFAVAAPLLLAGHLPFPTDVSARWGWSRAWIQPVGDPYRTPTGMADSLNGYRATRGVVPRRGGEGGHDGVDLANGHGGDVVRAAANGLVVQVSDPGWNRGYGRHVVVAHRLDDGTLVYSVYAHLAGGSVAVRRGDLVAAGRMIGRVGRSGRASAPHLHFEVRVPADPFAPWQRAPVVDPLAFIAARLPAARSDTSRMRPYLEWAECAALLDPGESGERRPTRAEWWRALLRATRHTLTSVPASGGSLRVDLLRLGILPDGSRANPDVPLEWDDLSFDLAGARRLGSRLPPSPLPPEERARDCRRAFGTGAHAGDPEALATGRQGGPSVADMCLALADLAGDAPPSPTRGTRPPR